MNNILIAIALVVGIIALILYLKHEQKASEQTAQQTAQAVDQIKIRVALIIDKHTRTLYIKANQLITIDEYGITNDDKFHQEVKYFFNTLILSDKIILNLLEEIDNEQARRSTGEYLLSSNFQKFFFNTMELAADNYEAEHHNESEFCADISPADFEIACARTLEKLGWAARTVGQTGDQGADVIATKCINGREVKAILQCKLYSSPVGNAAVQEVFSAKQHHYADVAAVVTNQSYTKSAKELSNTTGVILLHHDDLAEFDGLIGIPT